MTESRTQSILEELAREAAARLPHPGALKIQVSGLKIIRREESNRLIDCVSSTSVGFIVQGRKAARMLGANLAYGAGSAIVTSVELPDSFEAIGAARENPFFGIVLDLEEDVMTTVLARLRDRPVPECMFGSGGIQGSRAATVFPATEQMLDALLRLLRLADEGAGAAFMAPLVKEELYFRLLMSPAAGAFRALFSSGTPESRIREAAAWMRANYRRDFDVADTASRFGMSAATFYRYFREILGASPRQYVKTLRLYEAKRLMMDEGMDAAAAAFEVGYESAAYFSREYKRAFGPPPRAHVEACRAQAADAA
ncbi:AraC family transcriptional regulator [uncultured Sutterella sp.]|nr:AraC family transcriptional regulator [uncultured Sutterella sp.]